MGVPQRDEDDWHVPLQDPIYEAPLRGIEPSPKPPTELPPHTVALVTTVLNTLVAGICAGGIIYGWAPMQLMLEDAGAFQENCSSSSSSSDSSDSSDSSSISACLRRAETLLVLVYALSAAFNGLGAYLGGVLLDHIGPARAMEVFSLFYVCSVAMMASFPLVGSWILFPGTILNGLMSSSVLIVLFNTSELMPPRHTNFLIVLVSSVSNSSVLVPLALNELYQWLDDYGSVMWGFCIVCTVVLSAASFGWYRCVTLGLVRSHLPVHRLSQSYVQAISRSISRVSLSSMAEGLSNSLGANNSTSSITKHDDLTTNNNISSNLDDSVNQQNVNAEYYAALNDEPGGEGEEENEAPLRGWDRFNGGSARAILAAERKNGANSSPRKLKSSGNDRFASATAATATAASAAGSSPAASLTDAPPPPPAETLASNGSGLGLGLGLGLPGRRRPVKELPLWEQVKTMEFFMTLAIYCVNILKVNAYVGTLDEYLEDIGAPSNDVYENAIGGLIATSFLWVPLVEAIVHGLGLGWTAQAMNVTGVLYLGFLLTNKLWAQWPAVILYGLYMAITFGYPPVVAREVFGPESFGRITGLQYAIGGVTALFTYPLELWGRSSSSGWRQVDGTLMAITVLAVIPAAWLQLYSQEPAFRRPKAVVTTRGNLAESNAQLYPEEKAKELPLLAGASLRH